MKEFAATVKLHNNLLRERREMLGLSAPKFAQAVGLAYGTYVRLENLHDSPIGTKGDWRTAALKIAEYHATPPEQLWPQTLLSVRKNSAVLKLSAGDAMMLAGNIDEATALLSEDASPEELMGSLEAVKTVRASLKQLTPREEAVLRARFGLDGSEEQDLAEIGRTHGVSRERIRQIELQALWKLRHLRSRDRARLRELAGVTEADVKALEQRGGVGRMQSTPKRPHAPPPPSTPAPEGLTLAESAAYFEGQRMRSAQEQQR